MGKCKEWVIGIRKSPIIVTTANLIALDRKTANLTFEVAESGAWAGIRKEKKSICQRLTRFCTQIPVYPIYLPQSAFVMLMPSSSERLRLVGFVGFNNNFWFYVLVFGEKVKEGADQRQRKKWDQKADNLKLMTLKKPEFDRSRFLAGMSSQLAGIILKCVAAHPLMKLLPFCWSPSCVVHRSVLCVP